MSSSLEAMLALVEADVPERLISPHAFAALKSVCRFLPIEISSLIGFESRLAEKAAEVDLPFRLPVPQGLQILAGNNRSCRLPDHFFEDVAWERLRRLALDWQAWPKQMREAVVSACLEFDADQFARPVPSPGLLYLLIDQSDCLRDCWKHTARAAYAILKDRPIHSETAVAIDNCLERVPDHALGIYVGMGISRPTDAVRLALADVTRGEIVGYLGAIGWPGNLRELESLLLEVGRYIDKFLLGIDILASVSSKIAIEFYPGREEDSVVDPSWPLFLDFIKRKGWCLPEKSEGLLQWPGRNLFQAGNDSWPWVVERFLNHIKINYDSVSGVEAKAYFGLVWRPASATGASADRR